MAIVIAVLLLVGAVIFLWFCSWIGFAVPEMVRKLYLAIVALIGLYLLVALLFGIPSIRIIGRAALPLAMRQDAKVALGVGAAVIAMLLGLAAYGYWTGAWNMPLPP